MYTFFIKSIENKEKVMIYYLDGNGVLTQRVIKVIRFEDKSLLAFCYYRKHVRSFILENIISYGKIEHKATA
ncbi:hypothetical protein [Virgibacillus kimchii]